MRAYLHGSRGWHVDPDWSPRAPGEGEVAVRPVRVLVAGDEEREPAPGPIPGRWCVGLVEGFGPGVDPAHRRALEGRRVVIEPVLACGTCDLCRRGLAGHCRNGRTLGQDVDGCLAQRVIVPATAVCPVPDGVEDDAAVFAGVVGVALRAVAAAGTRGYVTVLGDSALALVCGQVVSRGNDRARVLGFNPSRYLLCEKWGVRHRHGAEPGRRQDQDAVIDCIGTPESWAQAEGMVRARGTIVLTRAGPVDTEAVVERELTVVGVSRPSVREGVTAIARDGLDVTGLITRRYRLEDAGDAVRAARDPDYVAVVVEV